MMPKDQQAAANVLMAALAVFVRECSKPHFEHTLTKTDLDQMEHRLNMKLSELGGTVSAIKIQITKVFTEQQARFDALTAKIAELEAKITADPEVDPAIVTDLNDAKALLQQLDDTIPDTTPPPTE